MTPDDAIPGDGPYLWDHVLADLAVRDENGLRRYGPALSGDALDFEYDATIDKLFALRKQIFERDGK